MYDELENIIKLTHQTLVEFFFVMWEFEIGFPLSILYISCCIIHKLTISTEFLQPQKFSINNHIIAPQKPIEVKKNRTRHPYLQYQRKFLEKKMF